MTIRPVSITALAVYIFVVFGISLIGSVVGLVLGLQPYDRSDWLLLALPKVAAFGAGLALWTMLRMAALLLGVSIVGGWLLVWLLNTGTFPTMRYALAINLVFSAVSAWVMVSNWSRLRPWSAFKSGRTLDA